MKYARYSRNDGHVGLWKVMIGWVVRLPVMTPLAMSKLKSVSVQGRMRRGRGLGIGGDGGGEGDKDGE